jgi:hypothetical protein
MYDVIKFNNLVPRLSWDQGVVVVVLVGQATAVAYCMLVSEMVLIHWPAGRAPPAARVPDATEHVYCVDLYESTPCGCEVFSLDSWFGERFISGALEL